MNRRCGYMRSNGGVDRATALSSSFAGFTLDSRRVGIPVAPVQRFVRLDNSRRPFFCLSAPLVAYLSSVRTQGDAEPQINIAAPRRAPVAPSGAAEPRRALAPAAASYNTT